MDVRTGLIARRFALALDRAARRLPPGTTRAALAREFGLTGWLMRGGLLPVDEALLTYRRLQDLHLRDTAQAVHAALGEVPHVFVKGAALLDTAYRTGDRESVDIDLLVPRTAREEATRRLGAGGWNVVATTPHAGPPDARNGAMFERSDPTSDLDDLPVEVAWAVQPLTRLVPLHGVAPPATLWSEAVRRPLPVPHPAHHVVLLAHHVAHHDLLHIKGLVDIALRWHNLTAADAVVVLGFADALGSRRAVQTVLQIVDHAFDLGLHAVSHRGGSPPPTLDRLCVAAAQASQAQFDAITPRRLVTRLRLLEGIGPRARVLSEAAVPPQAHLRWRWPGARTGVGAWVRHVGHAVRRLIAG